VTAAPVSSEAPSTDAVNPAKGLCVARDDDRFPAALAAARDYRGDVTVRRAAGDDLVGYLYDVVRRESGPGVIRMLPQDGGSRVTLPIEEIAAIEFSGRDTAAGKSFETWVRKYAEKKLAGEVANFEPDE